MGSLISKRGELMINTWDSYCITPEDEGSGTKVLDSNDQVQTTLEAGSNIIIEEGHISADGTLENVQANWQTSDPDDPSYILNKPTIPTVDQIYNANSTNAQSGVAVASAVSGAISEVNQVPVSISTDAGKVLKVNDQGEAVWGTDEGTTYTAGNGLSLNGTEFSVDTSVVATQSDLSDYQPVISDLNTIRSGAAAGATAVQPAALNDYATTSALTTGLASKQDTISDLATIRTGAGLGATAVQPAALADYQGKLTAGSNINISANNEISATGTLPTSTSADEGKFLIVDENGLPEWSDLSDGSSYSIANGSVVFTPGQYYTNGLVTLSNIRSNGIDYAYNHDGWVLEQDHTYVIAFNIVAFVGYPEPGNITGRIWLDGFQETDQVWKFSLDTSASHDESLVGSAIVCPQSTGEVHLNIRYDSPALEHIPTASVNKAEIVDVTARVSGAGATTYSAGAGLDLTGTTFSVDTTTIATKSDLSAYTPTASLGAVALSNDYADLSNKPTIPSTKPLVAGTNVTITENANDVTIAATDTTYSAGTGISISSGTISADTTVLATKSELPDGVPAVTSSDNNKTLVSTYNNGVGSYAWAQNTFVAVYGTTTYAEIKAAIDAGYNVLCLKTDASYTASSFAGGIGYIYRYGLSGGNIEFNYFQPFPNKSQATSANQGIAVIHSWKVDYSNTWTASSVVVAPKIVASSPLSLSYSSTNRAVTLGVSLGSTLTTSNNAIEVAAPIPDVTSVDDGKVLKASYSGGVGSYAWESEPTMLGLTAGSNVTITEANNAVTIAATDTTYSAGNMIAIDANNSNAIGVSTTAGITDIQQVAALPANPVSTVLYLIPET